ncbi:SPOR domain-containing protein [Terriglobus albidus]|uniref:SPOR domain-containing protein n=1 Tax=Terriglobus albidus TaxID=1592106 RepID=UPI0021DF43D7|nr:SPOR domain-containing protein [Terriglobus albidus]
MSTVVDDLDLQPARKDREIHLSTGSVLGIFFAAALICALFFGFGYTAGRRSAIAAPAEQTEAGSNFSNFKPAPGAVAIQPVPGYLSAKQAADANANTGTQQYYGAANTGAQTQPVTTVANADTTSKASQPVKASTPIPETVPAPPPAPRVVATAAQPQVPAVQPVLLPTTQPQGPAIVQVAAVSHQEDAEVLLSALKRRGYAVFTTSAPTDHLIHVQLGPFSNRKDAEAMRQRLLSDGYNAIVK